MINRRQLMQRGTAAAMAFTLLPKGTDTFARQGGSSGMTTPRSPMGEEIWTLAIDTDIFVLRHSGDRGSSAARTQSLVVSSSYMANIDLDEAAVPWEAPTPFAVRTAEGAGYPSSNPESWHFTLYGMGRAAVIEATTGDVVLDTPVSTDGGMVVMPAEGTPYVRESSAVSDGYHLRGVDLETRQETWRLENVLDSMRIGTALIAVTQDTVASHDLATGEALWSVEVPGATQLMFYPDGLLATSPTEITAMDVETGDMLWIATVPDRSELTPYGDYGLLAIVQNRLVLIDARTGLETWSISFDSIPSIKNRMDRSILISDGWMLKLIDLDTGMVKWESSYDEGPDVSNPREYRWRIWTGSTLAILASDEARIIWEWESDNWWAARMTSDHVILLRNRSEIACFSMETGRQLWTAPFEMRGEVEYRTSGGMLGIIVDNGPCHVFDLETGNEVRTIGKNSQAGTSTISSGYVIYFGNRSVSVTHLATGQYIGNLSISDPASLEISSSYITTDQLIALLHEDRTSVIARIPIGNGAQLRRTDNDDWIIHNPTDLYLYDSAGTRIWTIPLDMPISSIQIFQEQGVLFILFESHSWIVDYAEGRILWEIPAGIGTAYLDTVRLVGDRLVFITDRRASIFQAPKTTVVSRDIALRGAPNENAVERARLSAGTEVVPTGNTREISGTTWLEVLVDDVTGWVPESALTTTSATPSATPMATPVATPIASPVATPKMQAVDTSIAGLTALLPDPDLVPTGFDGGTDSEADFATVVGAIGGNRQAEQNLIDWGWTANVSRSFANTEPTDGSTDALLVSLHGFQDGPAANAALTYFADFLVSAGAGDVQAPALGEGTRLLSFTDENGNVTVSLFVQQGPVLYRFVGISSPGGDPTQAVIDLAKRTLAQEEVDR